MMSSSSQQDTKTRLHLHASQMRRRYNIALVLIAVLIASSFVLMQSMLYIQELRVRVSSLTTEQSRLFSDIGAMTRSLMLNAAANNVPEASLDNLRSRIKEKTARVRSNMREIVSIYNNRILKRFESETALQVLIGLELKLDKFLQRADEIASVETGRLQGRMQQWSPIDVVVSSATLIQNDFDATVREAFATTQDYAILVRYIEGLLSLAALALIALEAAYIFAPLMQRLQKEHAIIIAQQSELFNQARTDGLTRLGNRLAFQERLSSDLARADYARRPIGLVLFDLNHFKPVNDAFGHPAGDALLTAVAERAQYAAGEQAFVARIGGDEFAIVSNDANDPSSIQALVERVRTALQEVVLYAGHNLMPSAAFGGAILTESSPKRYDVLYSAADTALYRAKQQSLGFVLLDETMNSHVAADKELAQEFRRALSGDELDVAYEPQVRLADGLIVGFEARVLWRHPTRGPLGPDLFLPMAKRDGLITILTERVVDRVSADIRAWIDLGYDPGTVAINMPKAVLATGFAQRVINDALTRNTLERDRLGIEVYENYLTGRDADAVTDSLRAIQQTGIRVALDDVGAGSSSLYRLKSLPLDEIKIDRSLLQDLASDDASSEIVTSLIRIARKLNRTAVAQGIETSDHLRFLLQEGCPIGQGPLLSRPVPFADASRLIQTKYIGPDLAAGIGDEASRSPVHALTG